MAKHRTQRAIENNLYDEGDAVAIIHKVLLDLDDKAAVVRVISAVGALWGNFYVEAL